MPLVNILNKIRDARRCHIQQGKGIPDAVLVPKYMREFLKREVRQKWPDGERLDMSDLSIRGMRVLYVTNLSRIRVVR